MLKILLNDLEYYKNFQKNFEEVFPDYIEKPNNNTSTNENDNKSLQDSNLSNSAKSKK